MMCKESSYFRCAELYQRVFEHIDRHHLTKEIFFI